MSHQVRSAEGTNAVMAASDRRPTFFSRRGLLRALPGVVIGVMALISLTSCGGEDGADDD